MPHAARVISPTDYYHVVPKGVGDQLLFAEDADYLKYLELLDSSRKEFDVRYHAYCLMSNHVHLVLEAPGDDFSESLKYVHERYGMYYSQKIGRAGGIFRHPSWSEPIEDEKRLLCAVRYVHNNPAASGICRASQYAWSSVRDYLGEPTLATTEVVLELLGGREGFIEFSRSSSATAVPFEGSRLRGHLSDEEALRLAESVVGHDPRINTSLAEARLLKARGFSHAQIVRMTGLGRNQVKRA